MSDKYGDDTGENEGDGGNYRSPRDPPDSTDRMSAGTPVREGSADSDEYPGESSEREGWTGHGGEIIGMRYSIE